jgi:hypothetical protein
MPGGDRTGPLGLGPGTGWGLGYCSGYSTPGFANPYGFRSFGLGRRGGRGFGWRRGGFGMGRGFWNPMVSPAYYPAGSFYDTPYYPDITPEQEADMLRNETRAMQDEISAIQKRIAELESEAGAQGKKK